MINDHQRDPIFGLKSELWLLKGCVIQDLIYKLSRACLFPLGTLSDYQIDLNIKLPLYLKDKNPIFSIVAALFYFRLQKVKLNES
jgi:hypothetical protein